MSATYKSLAKKKLVLFGFIVTTCAFSKIRYSCLTVTSSTHGETNVMSSAIKVYMKKKVIRHSFSKFSFNKDHKITACHKFRKKED